MKKIKQSIAMSLCAIHHHFQNSKNGLQFIFLYQIAFDIVDGSEYVLWRWVKSGASPGYMALLTVNSKFQ